MGLFRRQDRLDKSRQNSSDAVSEHLNSFRKSISLAKQTNSDLNNLLVENHFTIKLWVAAGHKHKK